VEMTSLAKALEVYPRLRTMCCRLVVERQRVRVELAFWLR